MPIVLNGSNASYLNVFPDQIVDQLQDGAVNASHKLMRILDFNKDGKIDWKDAQVLDAPIYVLEYSVHLCCRSVHLCCRMFEDILDKASRVLLHILDLNKDGKFDWKDAKVLHASICNFLEYSRLF